MRGRRESQVRGISAGAVVALCLSALGAAPTELAKFRPVAHLTKVEVLSATPREAAGVATATSTPHSVPFFPTASDALGRQGFARVVNRSDRAGTVSIAAFDDAGRKHGPVPLSLGARHTASFNSGDLEDGNARKGLAEGIGPPSEGDWRLELTTELDVNVLSYIRTGDGFVTSMHDVAPRQGHAHRIAFFNPGRNRAQESLLRLVNPGDAEAPVTVHGIDDRGAAGRATVHLTIPALGASTFTASDLEDGATGLDGSLGPGAGKWRLELEARRPIIAIGMLATPTGHLTNLSTNPDDSLAGGNAPQAPNVEVRGVREFAFTWRYDARAGETIVLDSAFRYGRSGGWLVECHSATFDLDAERIIVIAVERNDDLVAGTVIQGRYRYRTGSECPGGWPGAWSHVGELTVTDL